MDAVAPGTGCASVGSSLSKGSSPSYAHYAQLNGDHGGGITEKMWQTMSHLALSFGPSVDMKDMKECVYYSEIVFIGSAQG